MNAGRAARWAEALAVLGATIVVGWLLRFDLAFTDAIPTGGDFGSHYPTFLHLRHDLLPRGRIVGWYPGNLAGFPMLEHYFPPAFLLMAAFSFVLPDPAAFKVAAILPAILFPGAVALFLRRLDAKPPVPAAGAILSLGFLLHETSNVWGGNLLALLAGEFSYAWGVLYMLLYLGEIRRACAAGEIRALPILLEAATAFSHGYAILFGGLASFLLLASQPSPGRALRILLATHAAAFLLVAGWIVPLLAYTPFTTAVGDIWIVHSFKEYLPPTLAPVAALAIAPLLLSAARGFRGKSLDDRVVFLAGGVILAGLLFRVAHFAGIINIRFAPFGQILLVPLAALAFAPLGRRPAAQVLLPVALAALAGLFLPPFAGTSLAWARWNLEGLPARPRHDVLVAVSARLRALDDGSRVFFEHAAEHNELGTIRIWENMRTLTGRPTLEGLHIEASPSTPYIFFLQSELSDVTSAPLRTIHFAHPQAETGLAHLRLFHARHLLVRSGPMKDRLDAHPGVRRVDEIGPYRIYERTDTRSAWATPLSRVPRLLPAEGAKEAAFRAYLRDPEGREPLLLPWGDAPPPAEWAGRAGAPFPDSLPAPPEVTFGPDEIRLDGLAPGRPVRLAVSYHPRWRVEEGSARIYAAAPSLLLVHPASERVVLRFGPHRITRLGAAGSLVAFLAVAGLLARGPVRLAPDAGSRPGRFLRGGLFVSLLALGLLPNFPRRLSGLEWVHKAEGAIHREDDPARGLRELDALLSADPTHSDRVRALHIRSYTRERLGDTVGARADAAALLAEAPESEWAPEAAYRAARLARMAGDETAARAHAAYGSALDPGRGYSRSCADLLDALR